MQIFTGNISDLPLSEVGATGAKSFDEMVVVRDENGGTSVLVPAGVEVSAEYFDAVSAALDSDKDTKPLAPKTNKSKTPPEVK